MHTHACGIARKSQRRSRSLSVSRSKDKLFTITSSKLLLWLLSKVDDHQCLAPLAVLTGYAGSPSRPHHRIPKTRFGNSLKAEIHSSLTTVVPTTRPVSPGSSVSSDGSALCRRFSCVALSLSARFHSHAALCTFPFSGSTWCHLVCLTQPYAQIPRVCILFSSSRMPLYILALDFYSAT
ncbi:hypothetical protein T440DRAFT_303642 [Plenodomus tracheiphilus IPT5]|uniref:Uncharacterized protein n=1 Tax=Plenodomus tracheiphilus IPT5 TaxID=1408161 RepID=A0A6A7BGY9_9PLEO|nr:hypothetical protein T440DRAFT_303642 [Plenodomus tracheiphilus IPT5]